MRVLTCLLILWPAVALAEAPRPAPDMAEIAELLPEALRDRIRLSPTGFIEDTAKMILAYGGKDGLDAQGIEWKIAADRARARALAEERFLGADLNGDDQVSRDEMNRHLSLTYGEARGGLELDFRLADSDADGSVSAAERHMLARQVAMTKLPDSKAQTLQATLLLDLDGNGSLTLDELTAAVEALGKLDLKTTRKKA